MIRLRNEAPIGVVDSGLGGLTVLRALSQRLPREDFVYLGDSARVPYGVRSAQTVLNYTHACARVLREERMKFVVVACNTMSAIALDALAGELLLPVIGVIKPGARAALALAGERKRVGVLATTGTVRSAAYARALAALDPHAALIAQPAPLLVPMIEEGWLEGELPRLAVQRYLRPLVEHGIDVLLLGCTHYPLIASLLRVEYAAMSGAEVPIVDSAETVADEVLAFVASHNLATERDYPGKVRIIVTDQPGEFSEVASRFLGRDVSELSVTSIDL